MDLDPALEPDYVLDARNCASYHTIVGENTQVQACLADPPYTPEFSTHYAPGRDKFPTGDEIVANMLSIIPVGGRVGILSLGWPRYPKAMARQIALVGVVVGNGNLGRWYAVYERTA
jgi:hypothetical protein